MHVEIKAADQLAVIEHLPGLHCGVPTRSTLLLAETNREDLRGRVQDALFNPRVWKVGTNGLRIEAVLGSAKLLREITLLVVEDLLRPGCGLLFLLKQHGVLALHN